MWESWSAALQQPSDRIPSHTEAHFRRAMERKVELVAFGLSVVGWLCAVLTRCLPMWRVSGDLGNTTGTLPVYWDGVWLDWEHHSVGALRCSLYQSLLSLGGNFRAWQAMITSSIGVGVFPLVIYTIGWLKFPDRVQVKVVSGAAFILSGVLLLIPVSWTTHDTTKVLETLPSLRRDWGEALYAGWTAMSLLILGGGILCTRCSAARTQEVARPIQADPFIPIHNAAFGPGHVFHSV
ncbi:claudin-4-like [Scleropages formosus]|uniref:Claudin-4-like n=1 Tax=Scleropages formosus TaxID=113540 RepID=A0A8C9TXT9_SCLFO|nr:claudin-4-like [Scleropages formosus]